MPIGALAGAGIALGSAVLQGGAQYAMQAGMAKGNSKRALRQQEKYTAMSLQANKDMADYNQQLAFENAKEGYAYQVQGLKKAGLNTALLYGQSGSGGVTSQGGSAPSGGSEHGETYVEAPNIGMGLQAGMGLAMMKAQIENLNADTKKKEADANKTAGVDTELARAQTQNYAATTENTEAQTKLTSIQNSIAEVQKKIVTDSAENAIQQVNMTLQKTVQEVEKMVRDNWILDETKRTVIAQVKQDLVLSRVETALKQSQRKLTDEQIQKVVQETKLLSKEMSWFDINAEEAIMYLHSKEREIDNSINMNDTPESTKLVTGVAEKVVNLLTLKGLLGTEGRTTIEGFKKRY